MKRIIFILTALFILLSAPTTQGSPEILINNSNLKLNNDPIIQNGVVLVPMRGIFTALGANVEFNSVNQIITITKGSSQDFTKIILVIGQKDANINNKSYRLLVPAKIINGSTFVPLRFVSQALGANVNYNGNIYMILLQKPLAFFA